MDTRDPLHPHGRHARVGIGPGALFKCGFIDDPWRSAAHGDHGGQLVEPNDALPSLSAEPAARVRPLLTAAGQERPVLIAAVARCRDAVGAVRPGRRRRDGARVSRWWAGVGLVIQIVTVRLW